jgi:hypothetical protein
MRRQPREHATLGHEVSRLLGVERAVGYATYYTVYDPCIRVRPRDPDRDVDLRLTIDLASMRRLDNADWEGSGQHVPFTAYPRRTRRCGAHQCVRRPWLPPVAGFRPCRS